MRLHYFDYFRAIAILFIVAGHSYAFWLIDSVPEKVLSTIITGGTALFVFISGFFFHHVFFKNFAYQAFMRKKITSVLVPYLILSTLAFGLIVIIFKNDYFQVFHQSNSLFERFSLYLKYLWTGRVFNTYWYIPFIMFTFALSPLFLKYIALSKGKQLAVFCFLLMLSMLVHRPDENLSVVHSFIYFAPIYLLGILFSIYQEKALAFLTNKTLLLGAGVVLISFLQIELYGKRGNFNKTEIFSYQGIDIIILQKILLIFFIIALLQRFANKEIPSLKYLAEVSFPIFFIHPWIIFFLQHYEITKPLLFLPNIFTFAATTIIAVFLSIAIANIVKRVLRKRSLYIIGW